MTSVVNGYTDTTTFKLWASVNASYDATLSPVAINSASRAIDRFCNRKFWIDANVVARTFEPQDLYFLDLNFHPYADIATSTGLIIKTDSGGDGTFETTWLTSDYELLPYNAAYEAPEAEPYTQIRAVGAQTWPLLIATALTRRDRVQITAKWGWPAVPDSVTQACLILAARHMDRRNSVGGFGGSAEFGPVRITGDDKDVVNLLKPYRKVSVLVA